MPTVVQSAHNETGFGTTHTVSCTAGTSGNTLSVVFGASVAITSVTDNGGNTYSLDHTAAGSNGLTIYFYRASNISGSPTVITLVTASNNTVRMFMLEASGLTNTSPVDGTSVGTTYGNGITNRSYAFTSNSNNCLGVVWIGANNAAINTGTSGWTSIATTSLYEGVLHNPDLGTSGSESATWTVDNTANSTIPMHVAYKAAGGGDNSYPIESTIYV